MLFAPIFTLLSQGSVFVFKFTFATGIITIGKDYHKGNCGKEYKYLSNDRFRFVFHSWSFGTTDSFDRLKNIHQVNLYMGL